MRKISKKQAIRHSPFALAVILAILIATPASSADSILEIDRHNAPLGLDLNSVQRRFPSCSLTPENIEKDDENYNIYDPLDGFDPPFPEITPTDENGNFITAPITLDDGTSEQIATLDWNLLSENLLDCAPPDFIGAAGAYFLLIFHGKVLAVSKGVDNQQYQDPQDLLNLLTANLPGQHGPIHNAVNPLGDPKVQGELNQNVPVYLTYIDYDNERTVVETQAPYTGTLGPVWTAISIAYIDLPLWAQYVEAVRIDLRATQEKQEQTNQDANRKLQGQL